MNNQKAKVSKGIMIYPQIQMKRSFKMYDLLNNFIHPSKYFIFQSFQNFISRQTLVRILLSKNLHMLLDAWIYLCLLLVLQIQKFINNLKPSTSHLKHWVNKNFIIICAQPITIIWSHILLIYFIEKPK
jgi:hypothetical protein